MLRNLLLSITICCMAMTPGFAKEGETGVDAKVKEDVKATLKKHDEAMNKKDLKGVMALYAASPDVVLMGTGPGEFWVGKDAIEDAYKHFFEDFEADSLSHECPFFSWGEDGSVAWLIASCQMTDARKGGKREYVLNVSAVLTKQKGEWQFRTMHFSNLTGGGQQPPSQ